MAELTKKLHFKKNTTEHMAKAYSTTAEAGAEYITNKIDGVTAYVPIGATNESRATMGRVTKNGTKAILTMGKPPYTEKSWITPGTYTFTVPAGVTRIRVAVCGGGAGGVFKWRSSILGKGEDGEASSAFEIVATGGKACKLEDMEAAGGTPNGFNGQHATAWTRGFKLSFDNLDGDYGKGGGGPDGGEYCGGSGGYNSIYVNVIAGKTYTIIVGKGGYSERLNNGNAGFVLIAYGGDI